MKSIGTRLDKSTLGVVISRALIGLAGGLSGAIPAAVLLHQDYIAWSVVYGTHQNDPTIYTPPVSRDVCTRLIVGGVVGLLTGLAAGKINRRVAFWGSVASGFCVSIICMLPPAGVRE